MSDKAPARGISYVDAAMTILAAVFLTGQVQAGFATSVAAWLPVASLLVWPATRWRSGAGASWLRGAMAGAMLVGLAALFWPRGVTVAVLVLSFAGAVMAAGLMLHTERVGTRPSRQHLFGLVALAGSVIVTIVLLEVGLRLGSSLFSDEIRQVMQADVEKHGVPHPYVGHLHRPNSALVLTGRDFRAVHHVDGLGFRNRWPWPERAEVVAVGDSLTFGYGVADDEAWPAIVAATVRPARLVNLGLIGAGPEQYFRLYRTFGLALQPKLLLVGVFGQNDFWDAGMFDRWLQAGGEPNYMVWRDFGRADALIVDWRAPLSTLGSLGRAAATRTTRRSYLVNLLRAHLNRGAGTPRVLPLADGRSIQLFEDDFVSKRALGDPVSREYRLVVEALGRLHALAAERGTHMVVVLQPGKEETYLPLASGSPVVETTSALRSALTGLGIEHLDLGPAFRARAAAGARLFYEVDGHPNADGYALTAELVSRFIQDHAPRLGMPIASPPVDRR